MDRFTGERETAENNSLRIQPSQVTNSILDEVNKFRAIPGSQLTRPGEGLSTSSGNSTLDSLPSLTIVGTENDPKLKPSMCMDFVPPKPRDRQDLHRHINDREKTKVEKKHRDETQIRICVENKPLPGMMICFPPRANEKVLDESRVKDPNLKRPGPN